MHLSRVVYATTNNSSNMFVDLGLVQTLLAGVPLPHCSGKQCDYDGRQGLLQWRRHGKKRWRSWHCGIIVAAMWNVKEMKMRGARIRRDKLLASKQWQEGVCYVQITHNTHVDQ